MVDPTKPMELLTLAGQAKTQVGASQTAGLNALRTSTGPAAALHTAPECAALGVLALIGRRHCVCRCARSR